MMPMNQMTQVLELNELSNIFVLSNNQKSLKLPNQKVLQSVGLWMR